MATILVIDDDQEVGEAIRRILKRSGFEVSAVTNSELGVKIAAEQHADVVITDIIMPHMDGVEVIKALKQLRPAPRVIAISGGGSFGAHAYKPNAITTQAFLTAATSAGADAVLSKPFDKEDLLSHVRKLLPN
jgi:CheY-like chemotaxis protein